MNSLLSHNSGFLILFAGFCAVFLLLLCIFKLLILLVQRAMLMDRLQVLAKDYQPLVNMLPLKQTKLDLSDKQQGMLTTIKKHHNLINCDLEREIDEDSTEFQKWLEPLNSYVTTLIFSGIGFMFVIAACSGMLSRYKKLFSLSAMNIAVNLLALFLLFLVLFTLLMNLIHSQNAYRQSLKDLDDGGFGRGHSALYELPRIVLEDRDGRDRMLFADVINDLDMIYQTNRQLFPDSMDAFDESLQAAWLQTNTSSFQAMTKMINKLSNDPNTMKLLIRNHDPLVKKIQDWVKEYRDFLQHVMDVWLPISLTNQAKYRQQLIVDGKTDLMDDQTRYRYFHELGKSIDELNK